jgi:cell division protein FtsB
MPKSTGTSASRRGAPHPSVRIAQQVVLVLGVLGVAWFAVEGGEYGTRDLLERVDRREQLEREIAVLQRTVDSLTAVQTLIATDSATLERIAREEYGMVRGDKELLYRFAR